MTLVAHVSVSCAQLAELLELSKLWPKVFPADEDRVEEFVAAMQRGEELPPLRAIVHPAGCFSVTDGAHRTAASLRLGYSHIPALFRRSQ